MEIQLGETNITLTAEGAAYIPTSSSLVIADVHLGKSATFRARGIPVPEGSTFEDLDRINSLIALYNPNSLIIAGDFVHSFEEGERSSVCGYPGPETD